MKDLFKKGDKQKPAPKAKKPLFGAGNKSKKPADEKSAKAKKPLFGAKKSQPELDQDDNQVPQTNAKGKLGKKPAPKGKGMDTSKLVPVLGGLLALILLGVAAKMFLFKEEPPLPPLPPVTTEAPPATPPAPAEPTPADGGIAQIPAPTNTPPADATIPPPAVAQEPIATAPAPVEQTQTPPQPQGGEIAPVITAPNNGNVPVPAQKMTYEEFVKESKTKVYRERETTEGVPAPAPTGQ